SRRAAPCGRSPRAPATQSPASRSATPRRPMLRTARSRGGSHPARTPCRAAPPRCSPRARAAAGAPGGPRRSGSARAAFRPSRRGGVLVDVGVADLDQRAGLAEPDGTVHRRSYDNAARRLKATEKELETNEPGLRARARRNVRPRTAHPGAERALSGRRLSLRMTEHRPTYAPPDTALARALALVRDLRARCPRDRAQTRNTLR